jgi:divalent metal cation (Fe/Co/Zn/Cd) transporter
MRSSASCAGPACRAYHQPGGCAPQFEKLHAIVKEDAAIEQLLSLRALYSGPEEVVVMAKIHLSAHMNIEQLSKAMDDLDHKIRLDLPFVADVFIDVTARRSEENPQT